MLEDLPIPDTQGLHICDSNGKYIAQHGFSPADSHILNIPGADFKHIITALRINFTRDTLDQRKRAIHNVVL